MADQVFENGEDMLAVPDNLLEEEAQTGLALGFAVPFCKHGGRDLNIPPKLFRRMATQKQTIEESGLALRELEVPLRLVERIGLRSHARKPQFTDFAAGVKSGRREKGNIASS
ncbi:MAG: hypothetical protein ACREDR_29425 [Blastocatellia bacterium]